MSSSRTILFAGGGTGGHIFPSLAILERLEDMQVDCRAHFLVSNRPLDAQILTKEDVPFTPLPVRPLTIKPWQLPAFYTAWNTSVNTVSQLFQHENVAAVVAMGGFVSGPAVVAARKADIPVVLVNLDAVPGRANRFLAARATEVFTAYPNAHLPGAQHVGLPLRLAALGPEDKREARLQLGLDPDRHTLLVTGASQGAQSVNALLAEMTSWAEPRKIMQKWQVLHLSGAQDQEVLRNAYRDAQVPGRVEVFCNAMGLAWRSADLAISRAGAGSVAEAWANACPTIFLPYPYHKDQHQRLNAEPLVKLGAAHLFVDLIDPIANVRQVAGLLMALMRNATRREHMAHLMRQHKMDDGASRIAAWLHRAVG